jgi:hypothetical protein
MRDHDFDKELSVPLRHDYVGNAAIHPDLFFDAVKIHELARYDSFLLCNESPDLPQFPRWPNLQVWQRQAFALDEDVLGHEMYRRFKGAPTIFGGMVPEMPLPRLSVNSNESGTALCTIAVAVQARRDLVATRTGAAGSLFSSPSGFSKAMS